MKATLSDWKTFLKSSIYADIQEDIKERQDILTVKLIVGKDQDFTDDSLRGRIDELNFIACMAKDIAALMEIDSNRKHTEDILSKLKGEK